MKFKKNLLEYLSLVLWVLLAVAFLSITAHYGYRIEGYIAFALIGCVVLIHAWRKHYRHRFRKRE